MAVRYSLWSFGIFFPFRHVWTKTNLAPLVLVASTSSFMVVRFDSDSQITFCQRCIFFLVNFVHMYVPNGDS
jgi:hypothetical protein